LGHCIIIIAITIYIIAIIEFFVAMITCELRITCPHSNKRTLYTRCSTDITGIIRGTYAAII
jgi:hypothetical protein